MSFLRVSCQALLEDQAKASKQASKQLAPESG